MKNQQIQPSFSESSEIMGVFKHSAGGFTLIELLISITIVGVILVIIQGALRISVRAWETGEKDIEMNQRQQIVPLLMKQQISSASWIQIKREEKDPYYFEGSANFVEFISSATIVPGNEFGKVYVVYRIVSDKQNKLVLDVAEQPLAKITPDMRRYEPKDEEFHELMGDVYEMSFDFLKETTEGEMQWEDNFIPDKDSEMPKAVRFSLKMTEKSPLISVIARLSSESDIKQKKIGSISVN